MPADDVSDLKDVFDAINRLCETMRTSTYDDVAEDPPEFDDIHEEIDAINSNAGSIAETISAADPEVIETMQVVEYNMELSPVDVSIRTMEAYRAERWSDALVSPPTDETDTLASDTDPAIATCEPASEIYYTASSEVSLLSDLDLPERPTVEEAMSDVKDKDEKKECVIAGHVAAMRERFESMTRANTPCAELARSGSPSLDVFRNITPSPDGLE